MHSAGEYSIKDLAELFSIGMATCSAMVAGGMFPAAQSRSVTCSCRLVVRRGGGLGRDDLVSGGRHSETIVVTDSLTNSCY
jgi:hypothetical protein